MRARARREPTVPAPSLRARRAPAAERVALPSYAAKAAPVRRLPRRLIFNVVGPRAGSALARPWASLIHSLRYSPSGSWPPRSGWASPALGTGRGPGWGVGYVEA